MCSAGCGCCGAGVLIMGMCSAGCGCCGAGVLIMGSACVLLAVDAAGRVCLSWAEHVFCWLDAAGRVCLLWVEYVFCWLWMLRGGCVDAAGRVCLSGAEHVFCWLWMLRGGCAYHGLSVCSAGCGCCGAGVLIMGRYDERRGFLTDGSNYTYGFPRVGTNIPRLQFTSGLTTPTARYS